MFDTQIHVPEPQGSGPLLARGMDLLGQAIAMFAQVDPADLPGEGLGEVAVQLGSHSRQLAATEAMIADRFSCSETWAGDAARTARDWFTGRTNDTPGAVASTLTRGKAMRAHSAMARALRDGDVAPAHLRALEQAHARFPSLTAQLAEAEHDIVQLARLSDAKEFTGLLTDLCHRLDPAAVDRDEQKRRKDYFLHASTLLDGAVRIDGLLPAALGAQFQVTLASARRAAPSAVSADDAETTDGEARPDGMADPRRQSQRNLDGLQKILEAAAGAMNPDGTIALPAVNGSRPVVHLMVSLDSLLAETQSKAAAWLITYGVPTAAVSAATAQQLVCDAILEPFAVNSRGELVATLPTTRAISPTQRKAVILRDVVCRIPGCHRHIEEVHHVVFYRHGGQTVLSNLAGVCWFHHHAIHHGPWTLTGDANAELILTQTATGKVWASRPPPKRE